MSEKKRSKRSVMTLVWNFFGYTTAHGFARISESKTRQRRTLWSLIVASAFVMFFYQVSLLLSIYISRPIGTQILMKHETVSKTLFFKGEGKEVTKKGRKKLS